MTGHLLDRIPTPDYQKIRQNFLQELTLASVGKPSSISFIRHELSAKPLLTHGVIQGIVVGGTNYILLSEEIDHTGKKRILGQKTGTLPIFTTKKVLENFLSEHLDPHADAIGVNFGFPLKQTPGEDSALDGTILKKGTKEHTFTGVTETLGTIVKTIFTKHYHRKITVSVANDTITMLLSGNGSERASLVAGTGFNIGLRMNKTTLVNLEAGDFNKFEQFDALKEIDAQTKNPGRKLFEKSSSGMYLPKHFNIWAKRLGLLIPQVLTGQELSAIAHSYHDETARDLARIILNQSASLCAAAIAAVYDFSLDQQIVSKGLLLTIIGEGGLLWDGWHYQETIQRQLHSFGLSSNTIMMKHIKDSGIKGALGLITNFTYE